MCVTNIAKRRNATLSTNQAAASPTVSVLSQRLMGNFMPLMMRNGEVGKALLSTVSTGKGVEMQGAVPQLSPANTFFDQQQDPYIDTPQEKKRPKRRRKPQKPGKTAKQNDRHFVVHNYHDHAQDPDDNESDDDEPRRRGGVAVSFPARLHNVLERLEHEGWSHVISWQPHGRCFLIHKPNDFQEHVMPAYFGQNKLTSFQRQLNLYGFCRLTRGRDAGAYYHEMFLRGKFFLTKKMLRTKIKGTKFKASSNPEQEPDFYNMAPVLPTDQMPSKDDSSLGVMGRDSPVVVASNFLASNRAAPVVSPVVASVAQPLSGPQLPMFTSVDSYSLLMNGSMTQHPLASHAGFVGSTFRGTTDDVLDGAVDELFEGAKNHDMSEWNGDTFGTLWDSTEFGQETRESDLQLGIMLDLFLQDGL